MHSTFGRNNVKLAISCQLRAPVTKYDGVDSLRQRRCTHACILLVVRRTTALGNRQTTVMFRVSLVKLRSFVICQRFSLKTDCVGCIDESIESGLVGKVKQLQCHTVCLSWRRGGRAMKMAGRCKGQWGGMVRPNRRQRSTRVLSSLS